MSLHGNEFRNPELFRHRVRLCQLIGVTVGNSQIADLSGSHGTVQSGHDLFQRRARIPAVQNIQIDVIHAEIFQALIQHLFNMAADRDSRLNLFRRARQKLRRDDHVFTFGQCFKRPADILFAGAALICQCGIKEIDSLAQRLFQNVAGLIGIQCPAVLTLTGIAEAHTPQTDS